MEPLVKLNKRSGRKKVYYIAFSHFSSGVGVSAGYLPGEFASEKEARAAIPRDTGFRYFVIFELDHECRIPGWGAACRRCIEEMQREEDVAALREERIASLPAELAELLEAGRLLLEEEADGQVAALVLNAAEAAQRDWLQYGSRIVPDRDHLGETIISLMVSDQRVGRPRYRRRLLAAALCLLRGQDVALNPKGGTPEEAAREYLASFRKYWRDKR